MVIKRLTLYKCLRFKFLNEVKEDEIVEHSFDVPINTLVGKIGSGKTSFMNYTIPHLVNHADFKPGGYRILEFSHGDSNYIVSNHYKGKNKHSIIKDGVELNISLRGKSYNEIIFNEVRIPQTLWNVISSTQTLTEASIGVRKEWFNILSPTNHDYALTLFKQLSTSLRDYRGAKKIAVLNLTKSSKVYDSDLRNMEIELSNLDKLLKSIGDEKMKVNLLSTPPIEVQKDTLDSLSKEIDTQVLNLTKNGLKEDYGEFKNEVLKIKTQIQIELGVLSERMETIEKHLDSGSGVVKKAREALESLSRKLSYGVTLNNWESVDTFLRRYGDRLIELFSSKLTTEEYQNSQSNIISLEEDISKLNLEITKNEKEAFHLDNEIVKFEKALLKPNVACPSCNTSFNPNIPSDLDLESMKIRLASVEVQISTNTSLLTNKKIQLKNLSLRQTATTEFNNILTVVPNGISVNNLGEYNNIKLVLSNTINILDLKKVIDSSVEIEITSNDKDWDKESMLVKSKIHSLNNELTNKNNILKSLETLTQKKETLNTLSKDYEVYRDYVKNLEIAKEISRREDEIINKRNVVNSNYNYALSNKHTADTLEKDISNLESKISSLNLLVTSLSPKEGIIAKSMLSFVGHCVQLMNKTLSSILDYDLTVELPEVEDDGLTYRFPVRMPDGTVVKDINSLSSGQKELVNISWLLALHEALGVDMPLYLDEFGNRLDQHHKVKAFEFVSEISKSGKQIIMITHFKEGHLYGANSKCLELSKNEIVKG